MNSIANLSISIRVFVKKNRLSRIKPILKVDKKTGQAIDKLYFELL